MDFTCRTRPLSSLAKDMKRNKIVLTHKLQRPEGQWNRKAKSDLIDSILRHYPINPTYAIKDTDTLSIIDGVQRLSTIRDFLNNNFALSKDMESIIINGEEKNLSGLKFDKLDDDTKEELTKAELQIYELSDCTEKDVREIFRRQNAGKPLSSKHMRVVNESDLFNAEITNLAEHPLMDKLMTSSQQKNGTDRDVIIQTLMLISTNQENDFTSFRNNDMNNFIIGHGDEALDKIDTLKEAMDKLDDSFEELKLPITSIPMILYSTYRITKDKKSFLELVEKIIDFKNGYDTNEEYKQFVQNGTGNKENVRGRFNYWRDIVREISK